MMVPKHISFWGDKTTMNEEQSKHKTQSVRAQSAQAEVASEEWISVEGTSQRDRS